MWDVTFSGSGRLKASHLEIHHAGVKDVAKRILQRNPTYANYTAAQWKELLDKMPAYPLDWLEHRAGSGALTPGVGFHDFLNAELRRLVPGPDGTIPPAKYMEALADAYEKWGDDATKGIADGSNIYRVVSKWIEEMNQ